MYSVSSFSCQIYNYSKAYIRCYIIISLYIALAGAVGLIFSGGMAGVSLWLAIFPADVIKSRIQVPLYYIYLLFHVILSSSLMLLI